jgi:hypothetical protein
MDNALIQPEEALVVAWRLFSVVYWALTQEHGEAPIYAPNLTWTLLSVNFHPERPRGLRDRRAPQEVTADDSSRDEAATNEALAHLSHKAQRRHTTGSALPVGVGG